MDAWSVISPLLTGWIGVAVWMTLLWLVQLRTRNAGIVDVGWAAALGGLAVYCAWVSDGWIVRRVLVAVLGGLWGARLAFHLLTDRILGKPEEGRYVTLRERWRRHVDTSFWIFFQAQALLAVVLALPFRLASLDSAVGLSFYDVLGAALWLTGWIGESVADRQLARWKVDPARRGRTCRQGLWRYSRHPNYFFEWLIWCGYATVALGAAWGWLGMMSPLLILYFVLKVTGIPPTEAQALKSRGDDYRNYQKTTSAFFPWFPREETS